MLEFLYIFFCFLKFRVSVSEKSKEFAIVTFINGPYKPLLYNFVCNLKKLNIIQYLHVFIADDNLENFLKNEKISYSLLESIPLINKTSNYGEDDYWYISRQKTFAFLRANDLYKSFIFSDVDVLWLSDPRIFLGKQCRAQICFQSNTPNGYKKINSGFFFVKTSNSTRKFFQISHKKSKDVEYKHLGDQDILNDMIQKFEKDIFWQYLKLEQYPNGGVKNIWSIKTNNSNGVLIIHNNWINTFDKKILRFKEFSGWFIDDFENCPF